RGGCGGGKSMFADVRTEHGDHGGVHDQVGDGAGEGGDLVLLFGHADGRAHGKEQSKVVENDGAALVHDVQHGVGDGAGVDDAGQAVGLQHGLVGEGTADAQQQDRKSVV